MSVLSRTDSPYLSDEQLASFARDAFATIRAKRVLCVVPDTTRSMPMPAMFRALTDALHERGCHVDFLIALGTHPAMDEAAILKWFGLTAEERNGKYRDVGIFNHDWQNDDALTTLGHWSAEFLSELSGGMLSENVEIRINKRVLAYDLLCVAGPVFPHEVVGFSGGNKYFFPGIAGPEILHLFHWLAALVTNPMINGQKYTPVRRVIDEAAAMIPVARRAFCLHVVGHDDILGAKANIPLNPPSKGDYCADSESSLKGDFSPLCRSIFFGTPEEAWSPAADAAAETHVVTLDRPYSSVLAMCPPKYYDLWVAGKCMYKLEPIVADGGELIIYAPHVTQVSATHGHLLERIGYHTRDYFLAQMDRFADVPGGILAHSTHVKGIGHYEDGVEYPRIRVTLATGISEATCRAIDLGYRDPVTIDPRQWENFELEGRLLVRNAGEVLYRLRQGNPTPGPAFSFS